MSAPLCGKCGGWLGETDADGTWHCILCGATIYRASPLDIPLPNRNHKGMPHRDFPRGVKPDKKSLAPNPGGARR